MKHLLQSALALGLLATTVAGAAEPQLQQIKSLHQLEAEQVVHGRELEGACGRFGHGSVRGRRLRIALAGAGTTRWAPVLCRVRPTRAGRLSRWLPPRPIVGVHSSFPDP